MINKIRIAVVGNCQARPLAHTLASTGDNVEITGVGVVHLLNDAEEPNYKTIFENSDLIFAQQVAANYPCKFVRTENMKSVYGDKVKIWPNLYYAGYNPELTYLRDELRRPLGGPLGDYHIRTVHDAWLAGLGVAEAVSRHLDDNYNESKYANVPEESLQELRRREQQSDIRIVDWIAERLWSQRLFFTFNHPAQALIDRLAVALALAGELQVSVNSQNNLLINEPLGQFSAPIAAWVAKKYGRKFPDSDQYKGREVLEVNNGAVLYGKPAAYNAVNLIEKFFRVYESISSSRSE